MTVPKTPPSPRDLRDEFAMAAMSAMALLSQPIQDGAHHLRAAQSAYRYADAMMEARKK